MPPPIRFCAATVVLSALLVAACTQGGAGATPTPQADTAVMVTLSGSAFRPPDGGDTLTISAGTTVTFVNNDNFAHTATHGEDGAPAADDLFDLDLAAGASGEFTFDDPGTYPVTCRIHPSMNMTVVVE
jgi:plastocyanin